MSRSGSSRVGRSVARLFLFAMATGLPLLSGCGGSDSNLAPVTGEVFYQGEPLDHGTIMFVSENSRPGNGEIENGKIVNVMTFVENDGAPVGKVQVSIYSLDRSEKHRNSMVPPSLIPRNYGDFTQSGLTAEIVAGQENKLRFDLE